MDAGFNQVYQPQNFQELFTAWNRFPDAVPYAGGTSLIRSSGRLIPSLPRVILSLEKIDELRKITRTERYLELGAMVRLSEIINLGKIVPEILKMSLEGIAGPQIRNLATIGGNLCCYARRLDASAAMVALDAHYELRKDSSSPSTRWISASRFSGLPGQSALAPQELLTRIRIPLEQWNYSVYRKFKSPGKNESGGVAVLILKNQKNILSDLRVVYSGHLILQDRASETGVIGKRLPLDRKTADGFLDAWKTYLASMRKIAAELPEPPSRESLDLQITQILNFIHNSLIEISD